jgi:hypothetical protein
MDVSEFILKEETRTNINVNGIDYVVVYGRKIPHYNKGVVVMIGDDIECFFMGGKNFYHH